jgi:hypothetical protein
VVEPLVSAQPSPHVVSALVLGDDADDELDPGSELAVVVSAAVLDESPGSVASSPEHATTHSTHPMAPSLHLMPSGSHDRHERSPRSGPSSRRSSPAMGSS